MLNDILSRLKHEQKQKALFKMFNKWLFPIPLILDEVKCMMKLPTFEVSIPYEHCSNMTELK